MRPLFDTHSKRAAQEQAPAGDSAPAVILTDEQGEYPLGLFVEILLDPTRELTIEEVSSPDYAAQFMPSQEEVPNFGYTTSAIWRRFRVRNETSQIRLFRNSRGATYLSFFGNFESVVCRPEIRSFRRMTSKRLLSTRIPEEPQIRSWRLGLSNTRLGLIDLYLPTLDGWQHKQAGRQLPFAALVQFSMRFQTSLSMWRGKPKNIRLIGCLWCRISWKSATADDIEVRLPQKSASSSGPLCLEVWSSPIFDEQKRVQYAISVFQDITERCEPS